MAILTSLKGEDNPKSAKGPARTIDDGPPPSATKPKPATPKGSLFQQASRNNADENSAGLGAEGGTPQVIGQQALSQILTGIQTLSTILPGIVPVLSDLTGRLSMLVPQMMNDMTNGGTGLVPSMGMPLPQPTPGMPPGMPPGAPPMGGAPGMPPGAGMAPPPGPGGPMGPPPPGMQPPMSPPMR